MTKEQSLPDVAPHWAQHANGHAPLAHLTHGTVSAETNATGRWPVSVLPEQQWQGVFFIGKKYQAA